MTAPDYFDAAFIKSPLVNISDWQLQHLPPRHQPLDAGNGVFYTGLLAVHQATGIQDLLQAVVVMGEQNKRNLGPNLMLPDPLRPERHPGKCPTEPETL